MSNYYNEAGEPLMDGAAMRYEMYLDSMYEPDPYDEYDEYDYPEWDDCDVCESDGVVDPSTGVCTDCGAGEDDEPHMPEDAGLDGYWEDRLSTLYE